MRRIVFSIAFFRKKLPVQSTPTSTKSRWKFYTQVGHRSFHTASTHNGHAKAHEEAAKIKTNAHVTASNLVVCGKGPITLRALMSADEF
jgi:hypothetical protein